jgi:MerR family transcriptional regulator, copper efflux regulator
VMATERTIDRLANAVGVNVQTVRYYERLHLLGPAARASSGYRLYGSEEEQRLRFIKNAQALGFTLREIAELLNLRVSSRARCRDVQRKAEDKLRCVEAKAQALQALAHALESLIRACRAGQPTDRCPILKRLEKKAEVQVGSRTRR